MSWLSLMHWSKFLIFFQNLLESVCCSSRSVKQSRSFCVVKAETGQKFSRGVCAPDVSLFILISKSCPFTSCSSPQLVICLEIWWNVKPVLHKVDLISCIPPFSMREYDLKMEKSCYEVALPAWSMFLLMYFHQAAWLSLAQVFAPLNKEKGAKITGKCHPTL